jgi:hypothetical protein
MIVGSSLAMQGQGLRFETLLEVPLPQWMRQLAQVTALCWTVGHSVLVAERPHFILLA